MHNRIAYIEDDPEQGVVFFMRLQREGIEVHWYPFLESFMLMNPMHKKLFDFVILDYNGTSLEHVNKDFEINEVETVVTSAVNIVSPSKGKLFDHCDFIHKDFLFSYIMERYGRLGL